ncbi:type I 3-dehydroquinate dehydratase [Cuniculiplasma sp. SKW3]|uniref:type I 3-dehydroquinate dehydratase n=1 Tax=Cuniculiplasma sp. SKW3 TaxID=3400170 RepID=UPI003FD64EF8
MNYFNCMKLKKSGNMPILIASLIPEPEKFEKLRDDYGKHNFIPEFRFDLSDMNQKEVDKYLRLTEKYGMKAIFTFRNNDPGEAEDAYTSAIYHDNLIFDVEIDSYVKFQNKLQSDRIILSSHFQNSAVTVNRFSKIFSMDCGAIKIATFSDSSETVKLISELLLLRDQRPLSFTPMGPDREARLISGLSLSDFMYSAYEEPLAPGQINYLDLENIFSTLNIV